MPITDLIVPTLVPWSACKPTCAGIILANMGGRYETEWEGLRLVVYEHPEYYQAFVYDPSECEVLYTDQYIILESAKFSAVEFAATVRFGPEHDLDTQIIAAMLVWEQVSGAT